MGPVRRFSCVLLRGCIEVPAGVLRLLPASGGGALPGQTGGHRPPSVRPLQSGLMIKASVADEPRPPALPRAAGGITVRHGFPYQPTALAFDPVQKILAIGSRSGGVRMYPFPPCFSSAEFF
ncbi:hypothetical protein AOLI_G00081250 [Acnodon oligacanthus]